MFNEKRYIETDEDEYYDSDKGDYISSDKKEDLKKCLDHIYKARNLLWKLNLGNKVSINTSVFSKMTLTHMLKEVAQAAVDVMRKRGLY